MIRRVCLVAVLAVTCLSGAPAGSEAVRIPQRPIATVTFDYSSKLSDKRIRELAIRYDHVILTDICGRYIPQLKAANPGLKVYLYESGLTVADGRDSQGNDQAYGNCVFGLKYVLTQRPEWLYPDKGSYAHEDNRYFIRATNLQYQREWASRVLEITKRWGFDGVFMDDTEAIGAEKIPGGRRPWEVQKFLHAVLPKLKGAGLKVILNACGRHISADPAHVYFDPTWVPSSSVVAQGYAANSRGTVPDAQFQEWAFFRPGKFQGSGGNGYERNYWLACLRDMDAASKWKTMIHEQVYGADKPVDPAKGIDGWLNFGLCSYLLGCNEYTTLAMRPMRSEAVDPDFALARRLGDPVSGHKAVGGDQFLQSRAFANGLVVVNAHELEPKTLEAPYELESQNGERYSKGHMIKLPPHTGRVFLRL